MSQSQRGSVPPLPQFESEDPDNTIRILLATDCHLGYLERDPIRHSDSLNSFREVLKLAVEHDADFVLLAGDLFHDNRPSRDVLHQTIAMMREYTLGDKPVGVELMSDELDGAAAGYNFPAINYADPNLNGSGPAGALCALDLLSVTGLVNYMGKIDLPSSTHTANPPASESQQQQKEPPSEGIAIKPVLLRKGHTKLALYGVGNIKDARMHYELRSGRVRMYMPTDKDEWFNILLVHQNRVPHPPTPCIPEGLFSDSVDLVVWGHEHDCRIIPEPVAGKKYYITQPGSTVATSLSEGESIEKHAALVLVSSKSYTLTPLPLKTVRPFVMDSLSLTDAAEEDGLELDDMMKVKQFLTKRVDELIRKAAREWAERQEGQDGVPQMLPLVRLRVDTTGITQTFNPIRFSQEFQGRVANPRDVLVFHRAARRNATRNEATTVPEDGLVQQLDDPDIPISEKLQKLKVGTLVREYLSAQELQLLGEGGLGEAISAFVEKDDSHSIETYVNGQLKSLMKGAQTKAAAPAGEGSDEDEDEDEEEEETDTDERIRRAKETQDRLYQEQNPKEKATKANGKGKGKAPSDDEQSEDSMMMDVDLDADFEAGPIAAQHNDDSDEEDEPAPKKKTAKAPAKKAATATKAKAAAKTKAPAKGRAKKKAVSDDDEEEEENFADEISDALSEDSAPPAKKGRGAILSSIGAKKATTSKAASKAKAPAKKAQATLAFVPSQRAGGARKAAVKARGKASAQMIESSDDE